MRVLVLVLQIALRLCWLAAIVLGVLFWTGRAVGLVPVHMLLGLLIALLLAVLAVLAGVRGNSALLIAGIAVAVLLPVVGVNQTSWVPGAGHWAIQVVHLLIGVAAIGVGEMAGARARRGV